MVIIPNCMYVHVVIIRSPVNQSACAGGTIDFTCVVMFTSGTPSAATWVTKNGNFDAITLPGHTRTDDSNGRSAPANVTTMLTVTNVSISDNTTDYFCTQGFNQRSNIVFLTVFGEFYKAYMRTCMHVCAYIYSCMYICVTVGMHRPTECLNLACNVFYTSKIAY